MADEAGVVEFRGFKGTTRRRVLPRADSGSSFQAIPQVDCKNIYSDSLQERKAVADAVGRAFREVGFLYAVNHGVPQNLQDDMYTAARSFFDIPLAEKMKVHHSLSRAKRGYQFLSEGRDDEPSRHDFRETFKVKLDPGNSERHRTDDSANLWPQNLPVLKTCSYRYLEATLSFAKHFLRIIALALDLDEAYFDSKISDSAGFSLFRYPPNPEATTKDVGRAVHTDYSWFTIVHQFEQVTALEVLNADGHFITVPPIPDSFVINVGDFLERTTNNVLLSTVHRVINRSSRDRFSFAYFFDADPDAVVQVAESCVSDDRPRLYENVRAGEWQKGLHLR